MELDWGMLLNWWFKLGSDQQEETIPVQIGQSKGGTEAKGTALAKVSVCWSNRKKAIVAGIGKGEGERGRR